ncbi:uncharacterized protein EAE97_011004 [Botrytis byssoidea]|uniref:Uncharacterized protein n=1 Tax=Botrytis byssoidea TaxID=139641 RepID=A0A9P5LLU1_9HELO|nr:uncharacterized protein EAE97_011004 [Botrytis byssoidea]KAF7922840.1 hypothetical protein EAE97_011004 [Botrytis byssoidea]
MTSHVDPQRMPDEHKVKSESRLNVSMSKLFEIEIDTFASNKGYPPSGTRMKPDIPDRSRTSSRSYYTVQTRLGFLTRPSFNLNPLQLISTNPRVHPSDEPRSLTVEQAWQFQEID